MRWCSTTKCGGPTSCSTRSGATLSITGGSSGRGLKLKSRSGREEGGISPLILLIAGVGTACSPMLPTCKRTSLSFSPDGSSRAPWPVFFFRFIEQSLCGSCGWPCVPVLARSLAGRVLPCCMAGSLARLAL
jgi:hypothetical protein